MSDRPFREPNRTISPGIRDSRAVPAIRLIAHDTALSRRLRWRFRDLGMEVTTSIFADFAADDDKFDTPSEDFVILDLGSTLSEIETAFSVLCRMLDADEVSGDRPRGCVLAPWFDPASRPAWAELGVRFVADRTTPPPVIVEAVEKLWDR